MGFKQREKTIHYMPVMILSVQLRMQERIKRQIKRIREESCQHKAWSSSGYDYRVSAAVIVSVKTVFSASEENSNAHRENRGRQQPADKAESKSDTNRSQGRLTLHTNTRYSHKLRKTLFHER